jgi:FkbM family methyltransferase
MSTLTPRQSIHAVVWAYRLSTRKNYPRELDFIKAAVTADDVCLDVGAHAGSWSYPLAKISGTVYAFEALPYYARVLKATLRLMRVANVIVINKAVSDHEDTTSLIWRDPSGRRLTGLTHIAAESEHEQDSVTVETAPLDFFFDGDKLGGRRVRFMKCDVEGYECHVVNGARGLIRRWRPIIFAEAQDESFRRYGRTAAEFIGIVTSLGYSGHIFRPDGTLQEISAETYSGFGDILFRPA